MRNGRWEKRKIGRGVAYPTAQALPGASCDALRAYFSARTAAVAQLSRGEDGYTPTNSIPAIQHQMATALTCGATMDNLPDLDLGYAPSGELPRDREIICFCKVSQREYEAQRALDGQRFTSARFLDGGLVPGPMPCRPEAARKKAN